MDNQISTSDKVINWFNTFIKQIKQDKKHYDLNILDKAKKQLYEAFANDDYETLLRITNNNINKTVMQILLVELVNNIIKDKKTHILENLAFNPENQTLYIWAKVDKEEDEDYLILLEARLNANLAYKYKFNIVFTISN